MNQGGGGSSGYRYIIGYGMDKRRQWGLSGNGWRVWNKSGWDGMDGCAANGVEHRMNYILYNSNTRTVNDKDRLLLHNPASAQ